MWEPRRLRTLWVSTACYRNNFTFFLLKQETFWIHRKREISCLGQQPSASHVGFSFMEFVDEKTSIKLIGNQLSTRIWTGFSCHRVQWPSVNTVINIWVQQKMMNFLTNRTTISFTGRDLLSELISDIWLYDFNCNFHYIVTRVVVRATKITGSNSDDWIY
jgi:hypothetical protein